jgi:hypothetical protein
MQKPPAAKGEICPFNGKDTSKVCHKCPLYVHLRGRDLNTGNEVDNWGCSFGFLPMLLVENSGQQRATGAAVEQLRNIVADGRPYVAEMQQLEREPNRRLLRST